MRWFDFFRIWSKHRELLCKEVKERIFQTSKMHRNTVLPQFITRLQVADERLKAIEHRLLNRLPVTSHRLATTYQYRESIAIMKEQFQVVRNGRVSA